MFRCISPSTKSKGTKKLSPKAATFEKALPFLNTETDKSRPPNSAGEIMFSTSTEEPMQISCEFALVRLRYRISFLTPSLLTRLTCSKVWLATDRYCDFQLGYSGCSTLKTMLVPKSMCIFSFVFSNKNESNSSKTSAVCSVPTA